MNLQLILRANKPKFSLQCRRMKELSIKFMEEVSYSDLIQFTNLQNQCWPTNPTKNFVKEPITPENLIIFVKRCLPADQKKYFAYYTIFAIETLCQQLNV